MTQLTHKLIFYAKYLCQRHGFENTRSKVYGYTAFAFDGKGCAGLYSEYLNEDIRGKIQSHGIDIYESLKGHGYAMCDHSYIVSNDKIIDPTFRQLFINTTGPVEKLFSPYAEYLYKDLPVIFEGTREEFKQMVHKIEQLKKTDVLHSYYSIHPIAYMMAEEIKE